MAVRSLLVVVLLQVLTSCAAIVVDQEVSSPFGKLAYRVSGTEVSGQTDYAVTCRESPTGSCLVVSTYAQGDARVTVTRIVNVQDTWSVGKDRDFCVQINQDPKRVDCTPRRHP